MIVKCVAYTFEQSRLNCILHSSTEKGLKYTRGKQTGLKKTNYTLSLPEISYCSDKNRKRRCRWEPKCSHVDCYRDSLRFYWTAQKSDRSFFCSQMHFWELNKSQNGYDVGFIKDEFDCITSNCECARFDQTIIGKNYQLPL